MTLLLILVLVLLIVCGVVVACWFRSRSKQQRLDIVAKRGVANDNASFPAIAALELMETGIETEQKKTKAGANNNEKAKAEKEASKSEVSKSEASKSESSKSSEGGGDRSEEEGSGKEDGV